MHTHTHTDVYVSPRIVEEEEINSQAKIKYF